MILSRFSFPSSPSTLCTVFGERGLPPSLVRPFPPAHMGGGGLGWVTCVLHFLQCVLFLCVLHCLHCVLHVLCISPFLHHVLLYILHVHCIFYNVHHRCAVTEGAVSDWTPEQQCNGALSERWKSNAPNLVPVTTANFNCRFYQHDSATEALCLCPFAFARLPLRSSLHLGDSLFHLKHQTLRKAQEQTPLPCCASVTTSGKSTVDGIPCWL